MAGAKRDINMARRATNDPWPEHPGGAVELPAVERDEI